jgi:hypothetical protein
MKAMWLGMIAAVVIAIGAGLVLGVNDATTGQVFSSQSTRL